MGKNNKVVVRVSKKLKSEVNKKVKSEASKEVKSEVGKEVKSEVSKEVKCNVDRKVNIPVMKVYSMNTAMMYSRYRDQPYDAITNDYFIVVGYKRKGRVVEMAVWYKTRGDYRNASLKINEKLERNQEVNLYDDVLFNSLEYDKEFVSYVEENMDKIELYVDRETLHKDNCIGNKAKEPIKPVKSKYRLD